MVEAIKSRTKPPVNKVFFWDKMKVGDSAVLKSRHFSHSKNIERSAKSSVRNYNTLHNKKIEISIFVTREEVRLCRVK